MKEASPFWSAGRTCARTTRGGSARQRMGREGGPGSESSGFSDGLLRARRWKAPGGKSVSRAATSGALVERLGRRGRRRERPSPGGHPTTTRVSRLLRSGAIERAVRVASSRELEAWTEGPITSMRASLAGVNGGRRLQKGSGNHREMLVVPNGSQPLARLQRWSRRTARMAALREESGMSMRGAGHAPCLEGR